MKKNIQELHLFALTQKELFHLVGGLMPITQGPPPDQGNKLVDDDDDGDGDEGDV